MNHITYLHQGDEMLSLISGQHHNKKIHLLVPPDEGSSKDCNPNKKRKILHRDVERQRRQEMTLLNAKLRSLLPFQDLNNKGKRSVSDDMDEAAKYIKHLQKEIKELTNKRDQLKRLTNSTKFPVEKRDCCSLRPNCVTVRQCLLGVEVTVMDQGLNLSKVLQVLVEEGLSVISCASSIVNEIPFYSILSEVSTLKSDIISNLYQRLLNLV